MKGITSESPEKGSGHDEIPVTYDGAEIVLGFNADPRQAITVGWAPTTSALPYTDANVGDTLTVPDRTGSGATEQILSFTVAEDADGQVSIAAEIADVIAYHRHVHTDGADTKARRVDYLRRTIAKARDRGDRDTAIERMRARTTRTAA